MTERCIRPAAAMMRNGYISNSDAISYMIACPQQGPGYFSNPMLNGHSGSWLTKDKSKGIPAVYMQADEDTRLALIAVLIDSDGYYQESTHIPFFSSDRRPQENCY